jgi:hypothetical protein
MTTFYKYLGTIENSIYAKKLKPIGILLSYRLLSAICINHYKLILFSLYKLH